MNRTQQKRNPTSITQSQQEATASQQAVQSSSPTKAEQNLIEKMEHSSTRALIFLSAAWFFLTVGVFTANPVGPIGIASLCLGIPCVAISIVYFILYERATQEIVRQRTQREASKDLQQQPSEGRNK